MASHPVLVADLVSRSNNCFSRFMGGHRRVFISVERVAANSPDQWATLMASTYLVHVKEFHVQTRPYKQLRSRTIQFHGDSPSMYVHTCIYIYICTYVIVCRVRFRFRLRFGALLQMRTLLAFIAFAITYTVPTYLCNGIIKEVHICMWIFIFKTIWRVDLSWPWRQPRLAIILYF